MRINAQKIKTEEGRWVQLAPPGTADILGAVDGRSVAVECKAAKGAQRETQQRWRSGFERAGGVYIFSRDANNVCVDLQTAILATPL